MALQAGPNMQKQAKFLIIFFLIPTHVRKKTYCMVMMSIEPSTEIIKVIVKVRGSGSKVKGRGRGGGVTVNELSFLASSY